jgi:WD40 repeat protein
LTGTARGARRLAGSRVCLGLLIAWGAANIAHSEPLSVGASHAPNHQMIVATKVAEFKEDGDVVCLQFSPDNKQLATTPYSTDHVHLWEWQGRTRMERTLMKPPGTVGLSSECLRYSPDGLRLAVAHAIASDEYGASVVDIFDPKTGALVHKIPEARLGGARTRIEFSPDGKLLVRTFDSDNRSKTGQFLVHRTDTWEVVWSMSTLPLDIHTLALTRDGNLAAVSGDLFSSSKAVSAQTLIIDIAQRKVIHTFDPIFEPGVPVDVLAWNPDGNHLALGVYGAGFSAGGGLIDYPAEPVKILDTSTGQVVGSEAMSPTSITGLRYTSDGKYLVESGYSTGLRGTGMARIWDGQHQRLLQEIPVKESFAVTISRDNRYLAVSDQRHVSIWTLK